MRPIIIFLSLAVALAGCSSAKEFILENSPYYSDSKGFQTFSGTTEKRREKPVEKPGVRTID